MKKTALIYVFACLISFGCSKKEKTDPEPGTPQSTDLTATNFIQDLKVANAKSIMYDSTLHAYMVTLPEGYNGNQLTLNFSLFSGAKSNFQNPEQTYFYFRGVPNGEFDITSKSGQVQTFKLYVKHEAAFQILVDLPYGLRADEDGNCSVPINNIVGLGTIPDSPGDKKELRVTLTDGKGIAKINGNFWENGIYFNHVNPLFDADNITLEVTYGDKKVVPFNEQKFSKARSVIQAIESFFANFLPAPAGKKLNVIGRGFSADSKYTAKVESDFHESMTVDVEYNDANNLSVTFPSSVVSGSYLVSFFENGELINRLSKIISPGPVEKSIGQMWKHDLNYPTGSSQFYSSGKLTLDRGKPIFANPLPVTLGNMYAQFDPNVKLPELQLKNENQTIVIKAVVKSDPSYADGSIRFYYGQYLIPNDIPVGFYQANLVYADKSESIKYWNKIEIK